jgi:hypothetical protein
MEEISFLQSPIGKIKIKVNNVETKYFLKEYPKLEMYKVEGYENHIYFKVDARYAMIVKTINGKIGNINSFECFIEDIENNYVNPETGENLELISFELDKIKLSIGAEYFEEAEYIYNNDGIKIEFKNEYIQKYFTFMVAWHSIFDYEKENIYTWFAADPISINKDDIIEEIIK